MSPFSASIKVIAVDPPGAAVGSENHRPPADEGSGVAAATPLGAAVAGASSPPPPPQPAPAATATIATRGAAFIGVLTALAVFVLWLRILRPAGKLDRRCSTCCRGGL